MERANRVVTVVLAILAMLLWAQGWWHAARPYFFGGVWHGSDQPSFAYPRAMATVLSVCACLGWVLMNLREALSWGEPRCRKCRYILHGVSEPRCPECGTAI